MFPFSRRDCEREKSDVTLAPISKVQPKVPPDPPNQIQPSVEAPPPQSREAQRKAELLRYLEESYLQEEDDPKPAYTKRKEKRMSK